MPTMTAAQYEEWKRQQDRQGELPQIGELPKAPVTVPTKLDDFFKREELEKRTGVSIRAQKVLESLPAEIKAQICETRFREKPVSLQRFCRFFTEEYGVFVEPRALAKYWRKTWPAYEAAEEKKRKPKRAARVATQPRPTEEA